MLQQPAATSFMGCIGRDAFGDQLRASAAGDGVNVHYMEVESIPTGVCAVLVVDTDRSLVTNLNAANHYKIDHLKKPEVMMLLFVLCGGGGGVDSLCDEELQADRGGEVLL